MHKIFLTVVASWILLSTTFAWAGAPAANFVTLAGAVTLEREGKASKPAPGNQLLVGDVLHTGPDGQAGVSFLDGTRIAVGPNSELVVVEYRFLPIDKAYSFDVHMKRGEAAYSSGRLGKLAPDVVKFRTPQTTIGIRGTKFLVRVD